MLLKYNQAQHEQLKNAYFEIILKCAVLGKMKLSFLYQSATNEVFVEFLYPYQYLGARKLKKKID